jgi:hypothetical protein
MVERASGRRAELSQAVVTCTSRHDPSQRIPLPPRGTRPIARADGSIEAATMRNLGHHERRPDSRRWHFHRRPKALDRSRGSSSPTEN